MRCVLVSATLPQHTFDELQELFMGLGAAFGPGLHRTAQGEGAGGGRGSLRRNQRGCLGGHSKQGRPCSTGSFGKYCS